MAKKKAKKHKKAKKQTTAIVPAPPVVITQPLSVVPKIKATIENLERIRRFVSQCLNIDLQRVEAKYKAEGKEVPEELRKRLEIDWGTIPHVDKPFLMQPGAEKMMKWLQLRPKFITRDVEHPSGHLEVISHVVLYSLVTNEEVFEGPDASCTTMETNYRYVWAEAADPGQAEKDRLKLMNMGRNAQVWKRGQQVWVWQLRIENPNIWNERNKVRQIGEKRGLVKCLRQMGAISAIFNADPSEWNVSDETEDELELSRDFTPGGRQIVTAQGFTPSGRPITYEARTEGTHGAAVEAGQRKADELRKTLGKTNTPPKQAGNVKEATFKPDFTKPGPQPANMGEPVPEQGFTREEIVDPATGERLIKHTNALGDSFTVRAREPVPADLPATVDNPAAEVKGTVEIDHTTEASPIVRGDISPILELIQKHCTATWGKDEWWHITPRDVETVRAMCRQLGFQIIETVPKVPPKAAPPATTAKKPSPAEPVVVVGVVERVFATTASNGSPMRQVTILMPDKKKPTYGCFIKDLFPYLDAGKGAIEAYTTSSGKFHNLVGLKSIMTTKGLKQFDPTDGKTPVIQNKDREAGAKTLFGT